MLLYVSQGLALYPVGKRKWFSFLLPICAYIPLPAPVSWHALPPAHHHHRHLRGPRLVPALGRGGVEVGTPPAPASCSAGALFTSQCFPPGAFVRRPGLRCEVAACRLLLHAWTEHDQFGCSQSLPGSAVTSASAHSTARQSRTGPSLFFFFNG